MKRKKRQVWTYESLVKAAKKFKGRREFSRNCGGAYNTALENGWLDEVCAHMPKRIVKQPYKWTKSEISALAKKYQTRKEFRSRHISAYKKAVEKGWDKELFAHMRLKTRWTEEAVHKTAKQYRTRIEFAEAHHGAYQKALRKGWAESAFKHMKKPWQK
jgi:hypothetical protein